jgi:hypothetical protein
MREALVLCGGASKPRGAIGSLLELDVDAPEGGAAKVNLSLDRLNTKMVADVPDCLADLLDIATYVYCADQFVARDTPSMRDLGTDWRRRFRFRIPVRDIATWRRNDVQDALISTLGFLSEDAYRFDFIEGHQQGGLAPYLPLEPGNGAPAGFQPDRVMLFSGGLDSLAGAAVALAKGERIALGREPI